MPDGDVTTQRTQVFLGEDLRHEAHGLVRPGRLPVGHRNAGALLAAVLQRVLGEESDPGYIGPGSIDAENAALLMGRVARSLIQT